MNKALMLSQYNIVTYQKNNSCSLSRYMIPVIANAVEASLLYSASTFERATIDYFAEVQKIQFAAR